MKMNGKRFAWLGGIILIISLMYILIMGAGCSLFKGKGTVVVKNSGHARVYCEFLWGPQNKTFYLDAKMTETCELTAGSYTFQVSKENGNFLYSTYIALDANTTQNINIPDW